MGLLTRGVRYNRYRKYTGGNSGMDFDGTVRPVCPVDSVVCNLLQSKYRVNTVA